MADPIHASRLIQNVFRRMAAEIPRWVSQKPLDPSVAAPRREKAIEGANETNPVNVLVRR